LVITVSFGFAEGNGSRLNHCFPSDEIPYGEEDEPDDRAAVARIAGGGI
jgi:hypothetical protein